MKSTYTNTLDRGILTSSYKSQIRFNITETRRASLSKMKNIIENHQSRFHSQTGTILQLSLFLVVMAFVVL